jgi:hypothetical protein
VMVAVAAVCRRAWSSADMGGWGGALGEDAGGLRR